jgi:xanthine dehydrogenase YagS FAD-binding subunit
MGGGQDLLGEMKDGVVAPEVLVNLKGIDELHQLEDEPGEGLTVGAAVTLSRLAQDPFVRNAYLLLAEAAESVATPQIRNVGTVGGNLCQRPRCVYYRNEHADCLKKGGRACYSVGGNNEYNAILGGGPSYIVHPSDLAPALVAYDATVHVHGPGGRRSMPLGEFFTLPIQADITRENVLQPGELVTHVTVPPAKRGWTGTYVKVRARDSFDFALTAAAVAVRKEGTKVAEARVVLGGVAPIPWRCESTEQLLVGRALDDATCLRAGEDALKGAAPLTGNAYKIPMTKGALTKALRRLR